MSAWTSDELNKIAAADELRIASLRHDGTLRKAVTIWVVRHGDDLYVRSAYGRGSGWFRGIQDLHRGRIDSGGVDKNVRFVEADGAVYDAVDGAYRTKYRGYPAMYVDHVVSAEARTTTIKLVPAEPARAAG